MASRIVKKPKADAETTENTEVAKAEETVADKPASSAAFSVPTVKEQKAEEESKGVAAGMKPVKICPAVNHECCIGGERYHLEKGVVVEVPQNVKDILQRGDLLRPLN